MASRGATHSGNPEWAEGALIGSFAVADRSGLMRNYKANRIGTVPRLDGSWCWFDHPTNGRHCIAHLKHYRTVRRPAATRPWYAQDRIRKIAYPHTGSQCTANERTL